MAQTSGYALDAFCARAFVRPGSLVLDIGAFHGDRTQMYLDAGAGRVLAFEPNPQTRATLAARFAGHGNVQVVPCALGERSGRIILGAPKGRPGASTIDPGFAQWMREQGAPQEMDRYQVDVWRLDDLDIPQASYWKIDVEGAEDGLLTGARATLRDRPPEALQVEMFIREAEHASRTFEALVEAFPFVWQWGVGDDGVYEAHAFPFRHLSPERIHTMTRRTGTPTYGASRIDPRGVEGMRWVDGRTNSMGSFEPFDGL